MEKILHDLGYFFGIFVNAWRAASGLAFLWDKKVTVSLLSCSFRHIDDSIVWEGDDKTWHFSGIYGCSNLCKKWKIG